MQLIKEYKFIANGLKQFKQSGETQYKLHQPITSK